MVTQGRKKYPALTDGDIEEQRLSNCPSQVCTSQMNSWNCPIAILLYDLLATVSFPVLLKSVLGEAVDEVDYNLIPINLTNKLDF